MPARKAQMPRRKKNRETGKKKNHEQKSFFFLSFVMKTRRVASKSDVECQTNNETNRIDAKSYKKLSEQKRPIESKLSD